MAEFKHTIEGGADEIKKSEAATAPGKEITKMQDSELEPSAQAEGKGEKGATAEGTKPDKGNPENQGAEPQNNKNGLDSNLDSELEQESGGDAPGATALEGDNQASGITNENNKDGNCAQAENNDLKSNKTATQVSEDDDPDLPDKEFFEKNENKKADNADGTDSPKNKIDTDENVKAAPDLKDNLVLENDKDKAKPKKGSFLQAAALAGYMKLTLKADDAGYLTTKGYVASLAGKAGVKLLDKITHAPPGATDSFGEAVEGLAKQYDLKSAVIQPKDVIDFSPSPITQEEKDRHTLVLDKSPDGYRENLAQMGFTEGDDGSFTKTILDESGREVAEVTLPSFDKYDFDNISSIIESMANENAELSEDGVSSEPLSQGEGVITDGQEPSAQSKSDAGDGSLPSADIELEGDSTDTAPESAGENKAPDDNPSLNTKPLDIV
jgi:hypothetical protein